MVLARETIQTGGSSKCLDCKQPLTLRVMRSAAGYYVGTGCQNTECRDETGAVGGGQFGEPHSRESEYFNSEEDAQKALGSGEFGR